MNNNLLATVTHGFNTQNDMWGLDLYLASIKNNTPKDTHFLIYNNSKSKKSQKLIINAIKNYTLEKRCRGVFIPDKSIRFPDQNPSLSHSIALNDLREIIWDKQFHREYDFVIFTDYDIWIKNNFEGKIKTFRDFSNNLSSEFVFSSVHNGDRLLNISDQIEINIPFIHPYFCCISSGVFNTMNINFSMMSGTAALLANMNMRCNMDTGSLFFYSLMKSDTVGYVNLKTEDIPVTHIGEFYKKKVEDVINLKKTYWEYLSSIEHVRPNLEEDYDEIFI